MSTPSPRIALATCSEVPDLDDEGRRRLEAELVRRVREEVGPVAALRQVDVVDGLPKPRSGKILRRTMRQIADGQEAAVPSTIEDVAVLEALGPVLRGDPTG